MFTLSGRVPDAETAQALTEAAEVSYAPFVLSGIEVDTSLGPAPWLATSPQLIGLLPSITDGTILVTEDRIRLSGRSPNQEYVDLLSGALDQLGGLPVEADVEITDLVAPRFVASVDDGSIDLSGEVPSEAIIELLTAGAAAAYGPSNVTSELTVDGSTYTSFWMFTMPGVFQLFAPFPAYEIQVDDGITTGALHGGILFAFDSSEVTEETAQILNVGVAVMARDRSIHMTVEGHTDSDGASDYNDELSMDRATSVIGYFIQAGISEDRLLATGVGEDDPIASNDTEQGRASNRRVEFLFGPSFDLGSPG
jgi:outer membrane protein OmpA-like peptidoglycan-associated protein